MNSHSIINGSHGFGGVTQATLAFHGFMRWKVKGAVYASLKKKDTAKFDESDLAKKCLLPTQKEGSPLDTGTPAEKLVNVEELVQGLVASFILLSRHINNPDPATGKRPEQLTTYLRSMKGLEAEIIQYATANSRTLAQVKANAALLGVSEDSDAYKMRVSEIKAAEATKFHTAMAPFYAEWEARFSEYCALENDNLVDIVEDVMTNNGQNPVQQIIESAKKSVEMQRTNFGKSNRPVDPNIIALASGTTV